MEKRSVGHFDFDTGLSPVARRVVVTGGAGFLGSHLCAALLNRGDEVLCVDNFYTGRRSLVAPLLDEVRFELVRHDVTFPLYVEADEVYNMACPASPIHYQRDPVQTTKTSVVGAINMLGLAKRCKAKMFQASTSEIYGDPTVHPQQEEYFGNVTTIGPRACYDEGKRCAETLCFDYHRQNGLAVRVARIFNTYGPNMHPDDGRVVSTFILQALQNQPITIQGDGDQTRSFCYVDDMIIGILAMMESGHDGAVGPINLGNPHEITVRQLAERIIDLTGSTSTLTFNPLPENDPVRRCPNIDRARSVLGWEPTVELDDGLRKTIAYFEGYLRSTTR